MTQSQKNQTMKQILNTPTLDAPPQTAPVAGGPIPRSFQRSLTKSWLSFLCVTAELSLYVVRSLQDVALVHLMLAYSKRQISESEAGAYIDSMWAADPRRRQTLRDAITWADRQSRNPGEDAS